MYLACKVAPCTREKQYDFCFQCEAFPCEKVDFEPGLRKKWLSANERMREIGVEAYFYKARDRSHYS